MLTVADVAGILNIRPKRVREYIHDESLPAMDLTKGGGRPTYRIDPDDLREFQDRHRLVKPATVRRRNRMVDTSHVIQFFK